jgi:hypothetical protein
LFLIGALAHQGLLPLYRRLAEPAQRRGACFGTGSGRRVHRLPHVPLSKTSRLASFLQVVLLMPLAFLFEPIAA